ncbi:MAG: PilZ domain-containing protein [Candidatus Omnitrophota bacterium]
MERRKYSRIQEKLAAKISNQNFDVVTETKNISANGAYCLIDVPIEPMSKLQVTLLIPAKTKNKKNRSIKKVCLNAVAVRTDKVKDNGKHHYYLAIYFNEISDRDRKVLLSYINSFPKS